MTPGDLEERVEKMLAENKQIPARLRNDMILALLMERSQSDRQLRDEIGRLRSDISGLRAAIDKQAAETLAEIEYIKARSLVIWVGKNKRLALAAVVVVSLAANVWFESDVLRRVVLWMAGMPQGIIP